MLKRVLKNFGVVIRGRGIAAAFSVLATGLMANALPATEFGLVILLHTYIMVIQGVLNFRTFETIVRFGIPLGDAGDDKGLRSLLRSTMMIDIAAALLATILGITAAPLAGHFLQWDSDMVGWAPMYSLIILATANGTPSGILRIYNRFDALSVQFTIAPALRFLMVSIAWAMDAPMPVFIIAWGSAFAVGHIYMIVRGLKELKTHMKSSLWSGFHWREICNRPREFWKFTGIVYWQTFIDLLPKHVSMLLAGALLGPAAAGLFRLAREFSTVLTHPAIGAVCAHELAVAGTEIPRYVSILNEDRTSRGGYLGQAYDPFRIGDPRDPLQDVVSGVGEARALLGRQGLAREPGSGGLQGAPA